MNTALQKAENLYWPGRWQEVAIELHDAAMCLWLRCNESSITYHGKESDKSKTAMSRPFALLATFALENIIKGILIYEREINITENGPTLKGHSKHKLDQMAAKISGCQLTTQETELLEMLQSGSNSWTRYFHGTRPNDVKEEYVLQQHVDTFDSLYNKFEDYLLPLLEPPGWQGPSGTNYSMETNKNHALSNRIPLYRTKS